MIESVADEAWLVDSGQGGPSLGISFGAHGNERSPIDAGLALVEAFREGSLSLERGRLLLLFANPRAAVEDQRWSEGGIDLNRCFHVDVLGRDPACYEEERARELVSLLERYEIATLVDFHCTVEPGRRFLMQHPPVADEHHRRASSYLRADILLSDPDLHFGAVSLDEWMSTRGRVGLCYETGWIGDPENTPEWVGQEMRNLLAGFGAIGGSAEVYAEKAYLQLDRVLLCEEGGFQWSEGVGENLQSLEAGSVLGTLADGRTLALEEASTLIFPKKRAELMQVGKPLVYLATRYS